tara:strand:- start:3851 stop:4213 length:363 start_codon:yes stop_codon:yes gene_type:complete
MDKRLVTAWEEGGFRYEIFSTPIKEEKLNQNKSDNVMMSVFEYCGNQTPLHGTGQRVYEYAKKMGAHIDAQEVNTSRYSGKIMTYDKLFLDHYFNEIERIPTDTVPETTPAPIDEDELPF